MTALRPFILSVMLALLEAVRQAEDPAAERPSARWTMRVPLEDPLRHPERCWFWGQSALAN
ncbi:MAG: hypothetical protein H6591_14270 [Flavobacteriales bacterium]|nr:hypothetical protein [Flavobacteriales bacterium]